MSRRSYVKMTLEKHQEMERKQKLEFMLKSAEIAMEEKTSDRFYSSRGSHRGINMKKAGIECERSRYRKSRPRQRKFSKKKKRVVKGRGKEKSNRNWKEDKKHTQTGRPKDEEGEMEGIQNGKSWGEEGELHPFVRTQPIFNAGNSRVEGGTDRMISPDRQDMGNDARNEDGIQKNEDLFRKDEAKGGFYQIPGAGHSRKALMSQTSPSFMEAERRQINLKSKQSAPYADVSGNAEHNIEERKTIQDIHQSEENLELQTQILENLKSKLIDDHRINPEKKLFLLEIIRVWECDPANPKIKPLFLHVLKDKHFEHQTLERGHFSKTNPGNIVQNRFDISSERLKRLSLNTQNSELESKFVCKY